MFGLFVKLFGLEYLNSIMAGLFSELNSSSQVEEQNSHNSLSLSKSTEVINNFLINITKNI